MFNGQAEVTAQDLNTVSTVQLMPLGMQGVTQDQRTYRYGKAGASQINAGNLSVAEAAVANHQNIAVAANAAVGAMSLTVTLGATAATQDQYAEGTITFNAGTGAGTEVRIRGNSATASSGVATIYLDQPLPAAITSASTKACLTKNPWKDVITSTTISVATGVPDVAIPAANYGWFQTRGLSATLSGAAVAKGLTVSQSGAGAGAVVATAAATSPVVGYSPEALVSAEFRNVYLTID